MRKSTRPPDLLVQLARWLDRTLFGADQTTKTKLQAGHEAEGLAVSYLKAKGYEIVERNAQIGRGELDIVARQGETLVIVEVKSGRASDGFLPREKVNPAKRRQLLKLTEAYRKRQRCLGQSVRLDIVEVVFDAQGRPQIEHLEGAVREGWQG
jgi:putative endonuclease